MSPSGTGGSIVRDYFARRAADYQRDSERWPWSWLRRREAAAVMDLLGDVAGAEVLELGCGAGFYTRLLLASGARHVVAADMVPEMVARLPAEQVTGIVSDVASVALGRTFRRILAAGLLEFVPDPAAVLANARAHAEEDARFVVLVPRAGLLGGGYRRFHCGHGMRVRLFSPATLAALAHETGWTVERTLTVRPFTLVARLRPTSRQRPTP